MTSKPYDELPWWWQVLDPWFGPPWYAEIEDFDAWLAEVRRYLAGLVDELADDLAGDDPPGEGYLAKVRRLTAARHQAEQIIRQRCSQLTPDEEHDEPVSSGERPVVVDRDHPSWAEVNDEQQERINGPTRE
jgi:hypothetical protein